MKKNQDISPFKFSDELNFISTCARLNPTRDEIEHIRESAERICNWQKAYHLAVSHGFAPILFHNLNRFAWQSVPKNIQEALAEHYKLNLIRTVWRSYEVVRLSELMQSAGIPLIMIKGDALASSVYGDTSLRSAGDIDGLISPRDLPGAHTILNEAGYRYYSRYPNNDFFQKLIRYSAHHAAYFSEYFVFELHWKTTVFRSLCDPDFDNLVAHSRWTNIGDRSVRIMNPVDDLVFLLVHGAKHSWSSLKWVLDIAEYMRKLTQEETVQLSQIIRDKRIERIYFTGLFLANLCFQSPIPEEVRKQVIEDPVLTKLTQYCLGQILDENNQHELSIRDQIAYWMNLSPRIRHKLEVMYLSPVMLGFVNSLWGKLFGKT